MVRRGGLLLRQLPVDLLPDRGNCGATGSYVGHTPGPQGFVVNETNGVWGNAQAVPGLAALNVGQDAEFYGISCAAPGDCAAGGQYGSKKNYSDVNQAFVVSETGGVWGSAEEVPGTASLDTGSDGLLQSVDCACQRSAPAAPRTQS